MDIKEEINALTSELNKANYEYYVLSDPKLTDLEFDIKLKRLQTLEDENPNLRDLNSPTMRVGSDLNKNFKQESHKYSMLSLGNTYSEGEVTEFYERIKKTLNEPFKIVCELKFDGVSISLTYKNGRLIKALTRGDGVVGDNVTDNVKTIRCIPLTLFGTPGVDYPEEFEVRGEILMPWDVFEELNIKRKEQEENLFANPRNAASGTLKSQNSSVVASRHLDSYLYYLLGEDIPKNSHYENMQMIKKWGFKISNNIKVCDNVKDILKYIDYWDELRKDLPVATDGIVLKVDSIRQQELLGYTAKTPRWAISYKFKAERALTRLNEVTFQVGRTGAITPVANLDPVHLSGTMVKRASLHNEDIINSLDLHIGDMVYVEKGGEIIPKITGVDLDSRILIGDKVQFINKCPECGSDLIRYDGESAYYCPNFEGCPPQIKGRLEHFISRKAMNIDSLGTETIDTLYQAGIVENLFDLYHLKIDDLMKLDRLGKKSVEKLLESIELSKKVCFERVLFALGIRFVGQTVAKILAKAFGNIDAIINANYEELIEVGEIGDKIAQSVLNYFKSEKNIILIDELKSIGLTFEIERGNTSTNLLEDKKIVISGTFDKHSRDEYKSMIENNGGKNISSISKNTSFILAGKNMGPAKFKKAEKLDIKIINEDEFLEMIKL